MNHPAHKTEGASRKDPETGFLYYGARYHWPEVWSGWLSPDPMMDVYPGISPYNYCNWNPVIFVDPDGRDTVYVSRNGTEHKRLPGGNSTFINVNNNWQEVPMPGIISERTQTHENTTGDEYQRYDHLIAAATGYFNADKNAGELQLYTDGNRKIPLSETEKIPELNPTLVKAIAMQESHCGRKTSDILQANNKGDWSAFKSKYGFNNGENTSVWQSLTGGIRILASKGYKGGVSDNGTFSFQGWKSATKAYNGGGNKGYVENVYIMYHNAVVK